MGGNDFIVAAAHDAHRVTVLGIGTDDDLLRGTASGDTLLGFAGDDDLVGRAGNDLLKGGSGEDVLSGGLGDDQLLGGTGEDVLAGGRGDDVLEGGNGADVLVGGQGLDLASYADAAQGVTVSLNGAGAGTSDAKADIFQGIEGLVGSKFRDDLTVHDRVPTWTHFCPRS
ncbi:MAG: hypothetical protein GJ676_03720 [Rhodobacteraceae bacterium]|nr:hypothetical protein [Paracoccaceae bacterium]